MYMAGVVPEITPNGDGSKWGISDLYDEYRESLRAAFQTLPRFKASWGSKKELVSCSLEVSENAISITVYAEHDEGVELVYDARWSVYKEDYKQLKPMLNLAGINSENEMTRFYGLTEETEQQLLQHIYDDLNASWEEDSPLNSEAQASVTIVRTKSRNLARALKYAEERWEECDQVLKARFETLKDRVRWYLHQSQQDAAERALQEAGDDDGEDPFAD